MVKNNINTFIQGQERGFIFPTLVLIFLNNNKNIHKKEKNAKNVFQNLRAVFSKKINDESLEILFRDLARDIQNNVVTNKCIVSKMKELCK